MMRPEFRGLGAASYRSTAAFSSIRLAKRTGLPSRWANRGMMPNVSYRCPSMSPSPALPCPPLPWVTQALAHELGPHGITVNALCSGVIDTERYRDIANATRGEDTSTEERLQGMFAGAIRATPLGRVGSATDVARVAAFLAGPDSDFITGLAVPVAGGLYMQ